MMGGSGQLLKRVREAARLQQSELADRAHTQPSRISRIENGRVEAEMEELVSLLRAVGTDESEALAADLEHPVSNIAVARWEELSSDDRDCLRIADRAIDKLRAFTTGSRFPQHLAQFAGDLDERLTGTARLLASAEFTLCFIGPIGVGKSSAINSIFNLEGEFRRPRKKTKSGTTTRQGILPTGSGRTTAFEFRLAHGSEVAIRIEPQDRDEIERNVRNLCDYWYQRVVNKANPERTISEEAERVYRNMARLTETDDGADPLAALIQPGMSMDDLVFEFLQRLNLPGRTRTELVSRSDREGRETEAEWIRRRSRQLNNGLVEDSPLPRRLLIVLPNESLLGDGFRLSVVDTRGIDETALGRREITDPADDPKTILILCSGFRDAPHAHLQQLVQHIKDSGSKESGTDAVHGGRIVLLVLPHSGEAEKVPMPNGEPAGTIEKGYRRRRVEVERALGEAAGSIKVRMFDSVSDDPAKIRDEILTQVEAVNGLLRTKVLSMCESVDSLLDDQRKAEFAQTQRMVRERIKYICDTYSNLGSLSRPTYTRLIQQLNDVVYASSVWSVTRNEGFGRSINLYQLFGSLVREDSRGQTEQAIHELHGLLAELRDSPSLQGPDMRKSRQYVGEIFESVPDKHADFLKQAQNIGEATLQFFMGGDRDLWNACLEEWGTGVPGYKGRVAGTLLQWFDDHPNLTRKLLERLQAGWKETFVGWLEGHLKTDSAT